MNWNALLPELVLVFGIFFIFILDLFASKKHYRTLTYISALVPIASLISLLFVNYPSKTLFDLFEVNSLNLLGKAVIYLLTS